MKSKAFSVGSTHLRGHSAGRYCQPQSQAPTPDHFSGILNDYTAATGIGGPWEMHATWSLKLKRDGKADFSVVMTMEHPDYWVLANPTPPLRPLPPPLALRLTIQAYAILILTISL